MVELNAKQRAAEKRENRMVIFLTIKPKTIPDSAENRENVATIVAVI